MPVFGPYPAKVVRVIDGDTFVVDIHLKKSHAHAHNVDLGFNVFADFDGVWLRDQHIRLFGCNAAEHGTPAGDAATAWLSTILMPGAIVELTSHGWDKFGGRVDGAVAIPAASPPIADLTAAAIAAGHALAWDGKGVKPV